MAKTIRTLMIDRSGQPRKTSKRNKKRVGSLVRFDVFSGERNNKTRASTRRTTIPYPRKTRQVYHLRTSQQVPRGSEIGSKKPSTCSTHRRNDSQKQAASTKKQKHSQPVAPFEAPRRVNIYRYSAEKWKGALRTFRRGDIQTKEDHAIHKIAENGRFQGVHTRGGDTTFGPQELNDSTVITSLIGKYVVNIGFYLSYYVASLDFFA